MQPRPPTGVDTWAGRSPDGALGAVTLGAQGDSAYPNTAVDTPHGADDRSGGTMSKLARAILVGATLAAMHLTGTIAVAHAIDEPSGNKDARPPTEAQVGEPWRHPQVAPLTADTLRPPTEGQVGEPWHPRESVPARPAEQSGYPGWLIVSLRVVAPLLALTGALAVLARRARRRVRLHQAA